MCHHYVELLGRWPVKDAPNRRARTETHDTGVTGVEGIPVDASDAVHRENLIGKQVTNRVKSAANLHVEASGRVKSIPRHVVS